MATANSKQAAIPSDTKEAGSADKGLRVTSRPESFRRGGHTFTGEAKVIPLNELTEAQAAAIVDDKNLVSQIVDIEQPKAEKAEKK